MDELNNGDKLPELPFEFRQQQAGSGRQQQSWNEIAGQIRAGKTQVILRRSALALAAVFVVVISAFFYARFSTKVTTDALAMDVISTQFGERKTITLPDSSVVVLNANSTLKIPAVWSSQDNRNVWLEGEAYFEITKKPGAGNAHFIVHTEKLDVRVLGTKFNVRTYNNEPVVALKEGKVELTSNQHNAPGKKPATITMVPGEEVVLKEANSFTTVKKIIEPAVVAEWTQNEFHFDNTPLAEIGKVIENTYGYAFEIQEPELMERTMSGHLHAANINEFIQAIEVTLHVKIEKKNKRLLIYPL